MRWYMTCIDACGPIATSCVSRNLNHGGSDQGSVLFACLCRLVVLSGIDNPLASTHQTAGIGRRVGVRIRLLGGEAHSRLPDILDDC